MKEVGCFSWAKIRAWDTVPPSLSNSTVKEITLSHRIRSYIAGNMFQLSLKKTSISPQSEMVYVLLSGVDKGYYENLENLISAMTVVLALRREYHSSIRLVIVKHYSYCVKNGKLFKHTLILFHYCQAVTIVTLVRNI